MDPKRIIIATPYDVRKYVDVGNDNFASLQFQLESDGFDVDDLNIEHFLLHTVTREDSKGLEYHTGTYAPDRTVNGAFIPQQVKTLQELDKRLYRNIELYIKEEFPNAEIYMAIIDQNRKLVLEDICKSHNLKPETLPKRDEHKPPKPPYADVRQGGPPGRSKKGPPQHPF